MFDYYLGNRSVVLDEVLENPQSGEFIVHPKNRDFFGLNYNLLSNSSSFYLMLMKDPHKGFDRSNRIQITGRQANEYEVWIPNDFPRKRFIDSTFIEVGAGLSEFVTKAAEERASLGKTKPIVIDPLDYEVILHMVSLIYDRFPGHRVDINSRNHIGSGELLERLRIYNELVDHYPIRIQSTLPKELEHLRGQADVVIDFLGSTRYSDNSEEVESILRCLLNKNGILLNKISI